MPPCIRQRKILRKIYGKQQYITIPCGKCMNCLSRKRQEWLFRLQQELKVSETCYFVTLTYDNEHLKYNSTNDAILSKDDVQKFMKRLRKQWKEHKLRYFLCGEYGKNTFRPHYHIILFNAPEDHSPNHFKLANQIEKSWQKGHVDILDDVKGAALNYAAKYIMMRNEVPKSFVKPFVLTSRRPGLGANYTDKEDVRNYFRENDEALPVCDGHKLPLPRFYTSKIFSEDEMEDRYYRIKQLQDDKVEQRFNEYARKGLTCREMAALEANKEQARFANERNKIKTLTKLQKL